MATSQAASITAANNFTTGMGLLGWYNVSVALPSGAVGSLGGTTVTLQRSFNNGTLWRDIKTFTTTAEEYGFEPEGAQIRLGVKTGQYVAAVDVRIGHEPGMTK
jgi:hypothetical protein